MSLNIGVSVETNYKFKELIAKTGNAITEGLTLAGIKIKGQAVLLADFTQGYQTGFLRNSLSYSIGGKVEGANLNSGEKVSSKDMVAKSASNDTIYIGTSVQYANYVESGTSRMSAQPYLRPAYDICKNDVKRIIKMAIERHIKGL